MHLNVSQDDWARYGRECTLIRPAKSTNRFDIDLHIWMSNVHNTYSFPIEKEGQEKNQYKTYFNPFYFWILIVDFVWLSLPLSKCSVTLFLYLCLSLSFFRSFGTSISLASIINTALVYAFFSQFQIFGHFFRFISFIHHKKKLIIILLLKHNSKLQKYFLFSFFACIKHLSFWMCGHEHLHSN